jgi:hypothetical protein
MIEHPTDSYPKAPRCFIRRLSLAAACTLTLAAAFGAAPGARAQNLVQDPNFANGFQNYTLSGTGGSTNGLFSDSNGNSLQTAVLYAPESLSQTITTTPGASYMISFLATFDPGIYTYNFGSGILTLDGSTGCCTLRQFSFTGIASGKTTDLIFSASQGAEAFTSLDVEAAPAPLPGSGALSVMAALTALAFGAIRKRQGARQTIAGT